MNTLHNLQQNFVAAVFDDNDQGFSQSVISDGIDSTRRLQIYHNNIYISLSSALSAVYPVVNRLVGNDFFNLMANEYIRLHPSQSGNLHDFGNYFPDFIESFKAASELVYLTDVAQLEWHYHTVFHAPDSLVFDIEKLERINERLYDQLIFIPNPASQLIKSPYPILSIWQNNQDSQFQENNAADQSGIINIDEGGTQLLVIRRDLDIEFQILEDEEYAFLHAIYNRSDFFTACDAAMQANPECNVSQLLLKHIQTHTLVDCTVQN